MPVGLTQDFELVNYYDFIKNYNGWEFSLRLKYPAMNIYSLALYGRNYDLDI